MSSAFRCDDHAITYKLRCSSVAYKRFADNVPLAIELVRGIERSVLSILNAGLGINSADGLKICRELAQESHTVANRRGADEEAREDECCERRIIKDWVMTWYKLAFKWLQSIVSGSQASYCKNTAQWADI
jgi:hypothetical protein